MGVQRKWTLQEKITATDMHAAGHTDLVIAAVLDRTRESINGFLRRDQIYEARRRRRRGESNPLRGHVGAVSKIFIPPKLWDDRDGRLNEPRTLSQEMFGDPPFSQSALAKLK